MLGSSLPTNRSVDFGEEATPFNRVDGFMPVTPDFLQLFDFFTLVTTVKPSLSTSRCSLFLEWCDPPFLAVGAVAVVGVSSAPLLVTAAVSAVVHAAAYPGSESVVAYAAHGVLFEGVSEAQMQHWPTEVVKACSPEIPHIPDWMTPADS